MFTGLIEEKGILRRRVERGPGARLSITCKLGEREPLVLGESIAVDGCCLTVTSFDTTSFEVDASAETLSRTTLGPLAVGSLVNLERATKLGARMGGHIVSGHVDGVGTVTSRRSVGDALEVTFELAVSLARFVAEKGSIAVNGVSLTVNRVDQSHFTVALIPVTRGATNLDGLTVGQTVNLEVDLLARYVARFLETGQRSDAAWMDRLGRAGYL
ncbi:MAG: riboflavin synthase [Myxococcales bacterium]